MEQVLQRTDDSRRAAAAADEAAIRAVVGEMYEAWARNDARRYAATYEEDADYVTFDGTRLRGRTAIEASHRQLFESVLEGTRIVGDVESIRFVTPEVAIVHATGAVVWPWHEGVPPRRQSRQTLVFVKRDGAWRATTFHNTRVRPVPPPGGLVVKAFRGYVRLRLALAARAARRS